MTCTHRYDEQESSVFSMGLCPLCLQAENANMRIALAKLSAQWQTLNQADVIQIVDEALR